MSSPIFDLPLRDAAQAAQVTPQTVINWALGGDTDLALKVGGRWRVNAERLSAIIRQPVERAGDGNQA